MRKRVRSVLLMLWCLQLAGIENHLVPIRERTECCAAQEATVVGVQVWDTCHALDAASVAADTKRDWELIPDEKTDHSFRGEAVLENDRLVVAFCRGSAGPVVWLKGSSVAALEQVQITPVSLQGESAVDIRSVKICESTADDATLEVLAVTQVGQSLRVSFGLSRGRVFLEVKPVEQAARIQVRIPMRFAVIPDFFGADMVFDPRAYTQAKVLLPSDNFLLQLVEGESTIVMTVWPEGDQQAEALLAGSDAQRRIEATEVTFDGKSIFVGILQADGIWHEHRLPEFPVEQDVNLEWKKPFPAQWRANFCSGRRSDSWDFHGQKEKTWIYMYGPLFWPCWFEGGQGFVNLSKRFVEVKGATEFVVAYPSDRSKDTPLATFTPVDLVRQTLGVGPCEYVLDREGLSQRSVNEGRKSFGRGVCDTTSPIEYCFLRGIECRDELLVKHMVDDILADNRGINARIQEYRDFGRQLADFCSAAKRDHPGPSPLLEDVAKTAKEIEDLYAGLLERIKTPTHVAGLGQSLKALTEQSDPENLGRCKVITRELRDIAGTQHTMVGDYRVMAKTLRQQAAIHAATDPASAQAAERIRQLARQILRKKYAVEAD